tara:strand:- start:3421 stop:3528 length:108 start_codon:yes stop_codon:yes gene_type:complete
VTIYQKIIDFIIGNKEVKKIDLKKKTVTVKKKRGK